VSVVTMKELLRSRCSLRAPNKEMGSRMKEFIFTERNGIHIFDLRLTAQKNAKSLQDWINKLLLG